MVDEFRVIFDIIDSTGSGELDLLGVKRACGLLGQKSTWARWAARIARRGWWDVGYLADATAR